MLAVIIPFLLVALALHQEAAERKKSAVKGSLERCVAAREAAVAALTVIVLGGAFSVELWLAGIYTMSLPVAILAALMSLNLKEHLEDDDWFGDYQRRLKQRLSQFCRRFATTTPQPSPA